MRPLAALDIEVFVNYFLVMFKDIGTGKVAYFEHPLDIEKIKAVLRTYRIVTFNGIGYDIPILMYALTGVSTESIKAASNRIIQNNLKPWHFEKEFNIDLKDERLDHVDLMEVAPLKGSLKLYGGRMHSTLLKDLPYEHDRVLSPEEKIVLREYCQNDLQITVDLYNTLKVQLELRAEMSKTYGIDLMSKSDAQIAEAVVKSEIEKRKKGRIEKPSVEPGKRFKYRIPEWMSFLHLDILDSIRKAEFVLTDKGSVILPPELADKKITIGKGVYRLGIGGLHSSEESVYYRADIEHVIIDRDVTSYYPAIVLNQGLYPTHIGPEFTNVYRKLVDDRLKAKKDGNKTVAESLKICVNGLFGKFGSRYAIVYSPDIMIQITLTGQLALLMLIEQLEMPGSQIISANTDGVTLKVRKGRIDYVNALIKAWEKTTGFATEEVRYDSLYLRDVNNYIAVKDDGFSTKLKGTYGPGLPLQKNPTTSICAEAVIDYLTLGASIEATVKGCQDVRKFVSVRTVRGGATYQGKDVGKVVRWYYAKGVEEALLYKVNGYLVPKTFGAKPLMRLPDALPDDLDYNWYIREAYTMLAEVGLETAQGAMKHEIYTASGEIMEEEND